MHKSPFAALARALTRRGLMQGLGGLAAITSVSPLVHDDTAARKHKKKGKKKRKRKGNGGDGGSNECGLEICDGQCVNLETDRDNCGACGAACPEGSVCVGGFCVAAFGGAGSALGQFNDPTGIAFNGAGIGFVADTDNKRLVRIVDGAADEVFAPAGFVSPVGVAVDLEGDAVYVVDKDARRVFLLRSDDGQVTATFGSSAEEDGGFSIPAGIAINPLDGRVLVTDFRRDRICQFTANGAFLRIIGGPGSGNGEFDQPNGMAFDREGNLFVADSGNNRIQVVDQEGSFVRAFGRQGNGNGEFNRPVAVAFDEAGNLFVVDQGNNRLQQLASDGQFRKAVGGTGNSIGEFDQPSGIAVASGNIAVVDSGNDRIQRFFPAG